MLLKKLWNCDCVVLMLKVCVFLMLCCVWVYWCECMIVSDVCEMVCGVWCVCRVWCVWRFVWGMGDMCVWSDVVMCVMCVCGVVCDGWCDEGVYSVWIGVIDDGVLWMFVFVGCFICILRCSWGSRWRWSWRMILLLWVCLCWWINIWILSLKICGWWMRCGICICEVWGIVLFAGASCDTCSCRKRRSTWIFCMMLCGVRCEGCDIIDSLLLLI